MRLVNFLLRVPQRSTPGRVVQGGGSSVPEPILCGLASQQQVTCVRVEGTCRGLSVVVVLGQGLDRGVFLQVGAIQAGEPVT